MGANEEELASFHIFGDECKRGKMSKDGDRYKTMTGGPRHTGPANPPQRAMGTGSRPAGRPLYLTPWSSGLSDPLVGHCTWHPDLPPQRAMGTGTVVYAFKTMVPVPVARTPVIYIT